MFCKELIVKHNYYRVKFHLIQYQQWTYLQERLSPVLYWFYFISWLIFSIYLIWRKDLKYMSNFCLLSGSILGVLIPIFNGIISDAWFWNSFAQGDVQIAFVDVFWLVLSMLSFFAYAKSKPSNLINN